MATEEQIEKWREAGKIASEVKKFARSKAKKGISIVELADTIEARIAELGGKPSFPVNIGINEKAAHYTPFHDDKTVLGEDLVKIDQGVALDGFPTDTAFTLDLTSDKRHAKIIEVTEKALKEAIKLARPGTPVREIGGKVHEVITAAGFSPIRNLSGHEIMRNKIHAGLSIPNYDNGNGSKLEENMIIALEPFATTGEGLVKEGKESGDFALIEKKPIRDARAREVFIFIEKEFSTLPFAGRWIYKKFGRRGLHSLRLLVREGAVRNYNELIEVSKQPTTHFEQTILVKDKPEVLTE